MMNFLSSFFAIYLTPVGVIMGLYFALMVDEDYDEDSVADFLEKHIDENIFGYFVVQTLFYAWIYVMFKFVF